MAKIFGEIAEKIEQRRLSITEALQREMQSLEKVEQTLNKRYKQSVESVVNELTYNIEEQGKELEQNLKINIEQSVKEYRASVLQGLKEQEVLFKKINERAERMIEEIEERYRKKLNSLLMNSLAMSFIFPILIWIGMWINYEYHILTKKGATREEVNEYLGENYEMERVDKGILLIKKEGN